MKNWKNLPLTEKPEKDCFLDRGAHFGYELCMADRAKVVTELRTGDDWLSTLDITRQTRACLYALQGMRPLPLP